MNLSVGNIMYLGLVVGAFGFFIGMLGVTAWRCNVPKASAKVVKRLQMEGASLKVHGDKLSHTLDAAT